MSSSGGGPSVATLEPEPGSDISASWRRWLWVLTPLAVFAVSRIISTIFLIIGAKDQVAIGVASPFHVTVPAPASPGYLGVVSNWDGQWYRAIAESGYPVTLPTEDGRVVQNEWAFLPAYPFLVRAVMWMTHSGFPVAATMVSLTCCALAIVLLYRMVLGVGGRFAAFTVVLGLCVFPASPVLQVGYAESLTLLLLVLALTLLGQRRYGWLVPVAVCLSLTRQVVLALAVLVALHWLMRWRTASVEPFPARQRVLVAVVAVMAVCLTGLWPAIAGFVTNNPTAYVETYANWASDQAIPGVRGSWLGSAVSDGNLPVSVVILSIVVATVVVSRRGAGAWGNELRTWSFVYPIYVLAITRPSVGVVRYLMLAMAPLWPLPDVAPAKEPVAHAWARRAVPLAFAVVAIVLQYLWVTKVFIVGSGRQPFP